MPPCSQESPQEARRRPLRSQSPCHTSMRSGLLRVSMTQERTFQAAQLAQDCQGAGCHRPAQRERPRIQPQCDYPHARRVTPSPHRDLTCAGDGTVKKQARSERSGRAVGFCGCLLFAHLQSAPTAVRSSPLGPSGPVHAAKRVARSAQHTIEIRLLSLDVKPAS